MTNRQHVILIIALMAAARVKGAYFLMLLLAPITAVIIQQRKEEYKAIGLSLRKMLEPLYYLVPYGISVASSAIYMQEPTNIQLRGVIASINISVLFIIGVLGSLHKTNRLSINCTRKKYVSDFPTALSLAISAGAIASSLSTFLFLKLAGGEERSIISGRPDEGLFAIGNIIFIFCTITLTANNVEGKKTHAFTLKDFYVIPAIMLLTLYPLATWQIFRGITSLSASILTCCITTSVILSLVLSNKKLTALTLSACCGLLIISFTLYDANIKEIILRYIIHPFVSSDLMNGRISLWIRGLLYLSNAQLLGMYLPIKEWPYQWTHNFILDTILYHGWIPCLLISAFLFKMLLGLQFSNLMWRERVAIFGAIIVMATGAMLQPIEFADGIAFQISFICFGFIWGMSIQSRRIK